jgi:acyl-CoA hydrolase
MMKRKNKPVIKQEWPETILPRHINPHGTAYGGKILMQIDAHAGYLAHKHSQQICTTLSIDRVQFVAPAYRHEKLRYKASVNNVWNTSMEVGIRIIAENLQEGTERHIVSAYTTFVAIDEKGKPIPIQFGVNPKTKEEKRRFEDANLRRTLRLQEEKETAH